MWFIKAYISDFQKGNYTSVFVATLFIIMFGGIILSMIVPVIRTIINLFRKKEEPVEEYKPLQPKVKPYETYASPRSGWVHTPETGWTYDRHRQPVYEESSGCEDLQECIDDLFRRSEERDRERFSRTQTYQSRSDEEFREYTERMHRLGMLTPHEVQMERQRAQVFARELENQKKRGPRWPIHG